MSDRTVLHPLGGVNFFDDEAWKPIADFPGYEVSNLGRVRRWFRSHSRGYRGNFHIKKPCSDGNGYLHYGLSRDLKRHTRTAHRLVAEAFMGPRPSGMQVNHKDGNKHNNRLDNLEYVTPAQNTQHAYENKLIEHPRGEDWYSSKLTEQKVRTIRRKAALGVPQASLSFEFGVCRSVICEIVSRKAWKHVQD